MHQISAYGLWSLVILNSLVFIILVRYTLIEMVWRLMRWQPDYPPIKKLRNALLSKRGKRRLVVAAARHLAIGLWRLATGRATAQELGLQLSQPKLLKSTT